MEQTVHNDNQDLEKHGRSRDDAVTTRDEQDSVKQRRPLWWRVLNYGVETGGIAPVPLERRTDTRVVNLFTVWFTMLLCLLPSVLPHLL